MFSRPRVRPRSEARRRHSYWEPYETGQRPGRHSIRPAPVMAFHWSPSCNVPSSVRWPRSIDRDVWLLGEWRSIIPIDGTELLKIQYRIIVNGELSDGVRLASYLINRFALAKREGDGK